MVEHTIRKGVGPRYSLKARALAVVFLPLFLLVPIALMGPNTLLALFACVVLVLGFALLWRPQEPPILVFAFLYQWVQATIATFYGNLIDVPVGKIAEHSGRHENAVALILIGLIVLAIAIRLAAGRPRADVFSAFREMVGAHSHRTWIAVYLVAWIFSAACAAIVPFSGGLSQAFLILAQLKWAAFLLLSTSTFSVGRKSKLPWVIAFVLEFILGLSGFFSDFSSVFFYSLIGISFSGGDILKRNKTITATIVVAMLTFTVAWTAVKKDYRDYLNLGTREQVVLVGYEDRMNDLFDRIVALDGAGMADGADKLVRRITYFEFFGVVLKQGARGQPHSGGEIWGAAVTSPFIPRLLFPNKPVADDTALTIRYTGINQPAWRTGTSVSLGYMTEAFIDFGFYWMFAAIAALGLFIGFIYRWLLRQTGWRFLVGVSFVPVALMPAHLLEISIVKLLPALVLSALAGWATLVFFAPMLFRWAGLFKRRPANDSVSNRQG